MSKVKAIFIFAGLFFLANAIRAQIDQGAYNLQNVIPPSPNAASLGKYANWPVNLYTGVPEISIPIYELKGRSISVPISLSYHASGIKVGEMASPVGLGWSLQAGGVITRSVRGLPDDDGSAGYLSIRQLYNNPGDLSSGSIATGNSAYSDSLLQFSVANGNSDVEPDLYMFSALGKSYKFYFSGNGTIVTQPYSNLVINVNWADSSWSVIMEDGTKLLFGGGNKFTEISSNPSFKSFSYMSSWYLNSITSPAGEVINFTYVSNSSPVTQDSYCYQADYFLENVAVNNLLTGLPTTIKSAVTKAQTQSVTMLYLSTIESDLGRVYFDTTNSRADFPGASAITGIQVFSKLTNKYLNSYKFNYSYSTASSGNSFTDGYTTPAYRLKLDTLEEIPYDNSPPKYWSFTYNPKTLPVIKSYAQDYWGYYNGATGNTNFLPFYVDFNPDTHPSAIRSADSASMMAEMLTKITYPTGGYSQFNYEPNSYRAYEQQYATASNSPYLYLTSGQGSGFTNTQSSTITITKPQYFNFWFQAVFSSAYVTEATGDYGPSINLATAVIKNSSGTALSTIGVKVAGNGTTYTAASILLLAGTYTFTISSISPQSDFYSTAVSVQLAAGYKYIQSTGYDSVNQAVGGVRIQSMFDYDGVDSTKSIRRYYKYASPYVVSPVDSTVDYLTNTTDNLYDCTLNEDGVGVLTGDFQGALATSVVYYTRNSSTKFSLGSIQGGTVGYGTVTEQFGANAANGSNVYYYTNVADGNIPASKGLPYPQIISMDYERGLLTEKNTYRSDGILVSKITNNYSYVQRNAIKTYAVAYNFNILSSCYTFSYIGTVLGRQFYQDLTQQLQHTGSTQTTYNTATGDSLAVTNYYYYDDTLNMQPIRTVTTNSKGDTVLLYSRTALEEPAINSSIPLTTTAVTAIDTMVARNMVGMPVESERYVAGVLTNKVLTNYKLTSNKLVVHDNVMVQNASNPIETRVQFTRYDAAGNLVEQRKTSDVKHSYIWDYDTTYTIAEVVNADSANTAYTSFEADGTGRWTLASATQDTTKGITGSHSYALSLGAISKSGLGTGRSYVVSYWTTNGTAYTSITGNKSGYPIQGKTITVNGINWTYFEHKVTGISSVSITGSGNIDELRLYPDTALMTTYTYAPLVGVTSQCDVNNRITYYQYDGFNRLYIVLDQDRNVIKKYCYNYFGQPSSCTNFYNAAASHVFTTVCTEGKIGSPVTYTVPEGKYWGATQSAADSLAQVDIGNNGQTYANENGTCSVPVTITYGGDIGGFTAVYTNVATGVQTTFHPSAPGTLGTVATGTYNITFSKSGNTTSYSFTVCSTGGTSGTSATFYNVAVSTGACNNITITTFGG